MLAILGAGGHAWEVKDITDAMGFAGASMIGPGQDEPRPAWQYAIGVGTPALRKSIVMRYWDAGCKDWPALIHPRAFVSPRASIGPGAVVAPGAVVGADSVVEAWALVNFNATIGHGSWVMRFAVVLPGANLACDTVVGECARIGAGAQLLPRVRVEDGAEVASSSMVAKDVPSLHRAIGVPARVMRIDA